MRSADLESSEKEKNNSAFKIGHHLRFSTSYSRIGYTRSVQRGGEAQFTFFFFFFGHAVRLAGSKLPNQGLNPGPGSECAES